MVRFYLHRRGSSVELYASPVNFDPGAPLFPISHPADFAQELVDDLGLYYTTGMVEDHVGLNNERLTEEAFLAQCENVWKEREAMMLHELNRFDRGLFYILFDTPDRVQHLFWRFREPNHPANRDRIPRPDLAYAIEDQYRRGDAVVGRALESVDDGTLVIVLSDHGFNSFQRGVDINHWLHANGYLALKSGLEPGPDAGDLLRSVDWSRTKAYAMGLAGIYLNLAGREAEGIVPQADTGALKGELCSRLSGLVDTERGALAITRAVSRESVYSGPYVAEAPDLLLGFNAGYRVSWSTSLGGVSGSTFEDNTKKWAGDHVIDPNLVPGFLVMNRPFRDEGPSLTDLAPTILAAFGCPKADEMEGTSLLK
jgi:predicted AlkP superfamily phosphohydrolase/phosphomutase